MRLWSTSEPGPIFSKLRLRASEPPNLERKGRGGREKPERGVWTPAPYESELTVRRFVIQEETY